MTTTLQDLTGFSRWTQALCEPKHKKKKTSQNRRVLKNIELIELSFFYPIYLWPINVFLLRSFLNWGSQHNAQALKAGANGCQAVFHLSDGLHGLVVELPGGFLASEIEVQQQIVVKNSLASQILAVWTLGDLYKDISWRIAVSHGRFWEKHFVI